jgi:hypothetical protein
LSIVILRSPLEKNREENGSDDDGHRKYDISDNHRIRGERMLRNRAVQALLHCPAVLLLSDQDDGHHQRVNTYGSANPYQKRNHAQNLPFSERFCLASRFYGVFMRVAVAGIHSSAGRL